MAERVDPPLFAGDAIRRRGPAARARRRVILGSAFGLGALALPAAPVARPLLVWNATASAPIGLYRVFAPGRLAVGDTVVARLPPAPRALAARRQ